MIATAEIKAAERAAENSSPAEAPFDWRAWYLEKRDAFTAAAKSWRSIAHTAQLDGDAEVVRMAHHNALENENWAKDAEQKAQLA